MSQGTNDAADNWTGQVKGQEEREGNDKAPRSDVHFRRENAKEHADFFYRYLLRSSCMVPDTWY